MFGLFKKDNNTEDATSTAIKNGAYLVDVRTQMEFRNGTVPTAVNIPLDEISQHIDELKEKQPVVFFCRSGSRSGMATQILKNKGLENVYNGGAWQNVRRIKEST